VSALAGNEHADHAREVEKQAAQGRSNRDGELGGSNLQAAATFGIVGQCARQPGRLAHLHSAKRHALKGDQHRYHHWLAAKQHYAGHHYANQQRHERQRPGQVAGQQVPGQPRAR
jgi:hypothetical protein